jgi:hypothetical protein
VQDDAFRKPRGGGEFELARRADVEPEPFLLDPVDDGPAQERAFAA